MIPLWFGLSVMAVALALGYALGIRAERRRERAADIVRRLR
jgi:hypothetical protein